MTRPAPGTRPANRRELIVAAASDLFYEHGYANVGMTQIAQAVAIGPSALYRHFPNKQKLLEAVIADSYEASAQVLDDELDRNRGALARGLATGAVAFRRASVLWFREARQIPEVSAALRPRALSFIHRVSSLLIDERADLGQLERNLLARCLVAAANSVSHHNLQLPRDQLVDILTTILDVMIGSPVFNLEEPGRAVRPAMLLSCSRREALLAAAIALFGRHGYTQVTMEQIGARVGIAAPSVYTYFSRKDEMLETALTRATVASRLELNRALASSNSPQEAVRSMIHSHCEFVFDYPDTVRLLLTEVIHLGEAAGTRFREAQADCISDWSMVVGILTPASPTLDVRIRVHAVLAMLNDIGTSSYPRRHANVLPILTGIALPVLTTPT